MVVFVVSVCVMQKRYINLQREKVLHRFESKTRIALPPYRKIIDIRDLSGRDIIFEMALSIPSDKAEDIKKSIPFNCISFKRENGGWGDENLPLTFSIQTRHCWADYWEQGSMQYNKAEVKVYIAHPSKGDCFVYISYIIP